MEINTGTAVALFGAGYFNLVRRGADGSLILSADRWRLEKLQDGSVVFLPHDEVADATVISLDQVEKITWDRLPRQLRRSQIRFHLSNGDRWTFSGQVNEAELPGVEPELG